MSYSLCPAQEPQGGTAQLSAYCSATVQDDGAVAGTLQTAYHLHVPIIIVSAVRHHWFLCTSAAGGSLPPTAPQQASSASSECPAVHPARLPPTHSLRSLLCVLPGRLPAAPEALTASRPAPPARPTTTLPLTACPARQRLQLPLPAPPRPSSSPSPSLQAAQSGATRQPLSRPVAAPTACECLLDAVVPAQLMTGALLPLPARAAHASVVAVHT